MTTRLVTTIFFVSFVASPVFAECSKKELLQFIELGFSKKEIKQICKDESITFDENMDQSEEPKEVVEKPVQVEEEAYVETKKIEAYDASDKETKASDQSTIKKYLDVMTFGVFEDDEKIDDKDDIKKEMPNTAKQSGEEENSKVPIKNHHLLLEFGSLNGYYNFSSDEEIFKEYSGKLNHGLNGSAFAVSYQYIHNKFVVGTGYHSYNIEGESDKSRQNFSSNGIDYDLEIKNLHKISISGLFIILGYEFKLFTKYELTPQVRYGFSNEISADSTLEVIDHDPTNIEDVTGSSKVDYEIKSDVKIFALPVVYRFDTFSAGLNFYSMRNEFFYQEDTTTLKTRTKEGILLSFGNKF